MDIIESYYPSEYYQSLQLLQGLVNQQVISLDEYFQCLDRVPYGQSKVMAAGQ